MNLFRAFRTRDEAPGVAGIVHDTGMFFATEQLGPNRYMTPEGFLVCVGVPIARTGSQIYGPGQCPIEPGPDGVVIVHRLPEHVFAPDTMASATLKDICDEHPDDDIMPFNYRRLTCGQIFNIRRGEGTEDELLLADFMVKEPKTIKDILDGLDPKKPNAGKIEVSLGYTADYFKTGPGVGEQRRLRVNHVALVPRGRCGPRCSIQDHAHEPHAVKPTTPAIIETPAEPEAPACGCHSKEKDMTIHAPKTFGQRVLDAITGKVKDEDMKKVEDAIAAAAKDEEAEKKNDEKFVTKDDFDKHVKANDANFQKVHDAMTGLAESLKGKTQDNEDDKGGKDDKGKTEDNDGKTDEEKAKAADAEAERENAEVKDELEEEAPDDKKPVAAKARDSAYLEESFTDTVAAANILVPGIQVPTFDRAEKPSKTYKDGICGMRRRTLDAYYQTTAGKNFLDAQFRGRAINFRDEKAITCQRVTDAFHAAVAHQSAVNNGQVGELTIKKSAGQQLPGAGAPAISASKLARQASQAWK